MKGKKLALVLSLMAITTFIPNKASAVVSYIENTGASVASLSTTDRAGIDINKDWTIKFNKSISLADINPSLIKVTDESGKALPVTFAVGRNNNEIVVKAPLNGYGYNKKYTLTVSNGMYGNLKLKETSTMKFTTKNEDMSNEYTKEQREKDIFGDIDLAHNVYLEYVKETQHDKDKFYWLESDSNYTSYEEYEDYNTKFLEKYMNKPEYSNVTDLDYYKNIPGLTINFDKVNNSNRSLREVSPLFSDYDMPRGSIGFFYNQVNPYLTAIWRVDTAKEIVDEINKNRLQKGLKELTLDPDLSAISMWGAKRSFINQVRDMTIQPLMLGQEEEWERYDNQANKEYLDMSKHFPAPTKPLGWNRYEILHGTTPMVSKYAEGLYSGGNKGDYELYYNTQLERDLNKYFDYDKPIRLINYTTQFDYTGEKIVKRLSERGKIGRDNTQSYRLSQYCTNRVFNDEIYNDNIENIGVGVIYEKALNGHFNGTFVIYIIVS